MLRPVSRQDVLQPEQSPWAPLSRGGYYGLTGLRDPATGQKRVSHQHRRRPGTLKLTHFYLDM